MIGYVNYAGKNLYSAEKTNGLLMVDARDYRLTVGEKRPIVENSTIFFLEVFPYLVQLILYIPSHLEMSALVLCTEKYLMLPGDYLVSVAL